MFLFSIFFMFFNSFYISFFSFFVMCFNVYGFTMATSLVSFWGFYIQPRTFHLPLPLKSTMNMHHDFPLTYRWFWTQPLLYENWPLGLMASYVTNHFALFLTYFWYFILIYVQGNVILPMIFFIFWKFFYRNAIMVYWTRAS